jgi:LCP family protein required for cell wall assembly
MLLLIATLVLAACGPEAPAPGGSSGGTDAAALEAAAPDSAADTAAAAAPAEAAPAADAAAAATEAPRNAVPEVIAEAPVQPLDVDARFPLSYTTNILVLGSDRREGQPNWRTDVMMIVALDMKNNRAGVISIPRDVYLEEIPGHNPNKINVVDYLGEQDEPDGGGPKLLGSLIEEKMGVPIHHFVRFDFTGFVDLVDALDGVEVEIDCPYYDYFQIEDVVLNVKPGVQRLTGEEALVYVRSRKIGGDLDRARRQQRFIWAVRNQVLNENILPKLPALYNALSDSVQTDMGVVQTLKVVRMAIGLDREDIHGFVIGYPLVEEGYAGNMWVFRADWPAIREQAQKVFESDPFLDTNTLVECP